MRYLSIALLLIVSTAHAEDWQQIATLDSNGGVLLFDAAGVTEVKGFRRAWFKAVYTSDRAIPNDYLSSVPADSRTYRSERTLRYFDCSARTGAVMRYFWDGAEDKSAGYHYQETLTFRPASAGSLEERMLDTACNFTGELATAEAAKLQLPQVVAKMKRPVNPDDYYPASARHQGATGSPVVQACVGPSGDLLREPVVTESSGIPEMDAAAIKVAKATRYAAGTQQGVAVPESCIKFKVKFTARH